jgi:hypothetical protein
VKAVYFEDISTNRLKEFKDTLAHLIEAEKLVV